MRILLVMDPGILVPPKGYGGIERIVEIMAKEYLAMGHEVHLLVTTGSYVEGCIIHPYGKEEFPQEASDVRKGIWYAWKFLWKHRNYFDLVHNFGRLIYLLPILGNAQKKIMTYQREISNRNVGFIHFLRAKNFFFTACSSDLMSRLKKKEYNWEAVYNAINFNKYSLTKDLPADAPLIFLGRIEKVKGCHTAIQLAKKTGEKLIIAGNISTLPEEKLYYEEEIKPHIDGEQIKYVGVLDDEQKNYYLGQSKAMVFPIHWNEPFGIVMIEAMACGTPVIGYNKGSVEEVIDEGITGYKVNDFEEMVEAVRRLSEIDRAKCREKAAERFDAPVIARHYLGLFNPAPEGKKVLIVTTGQPATNPRVVKEYQALCEKGYSVKVMYTHSADWAYEIDRTKFDKGVFNHRDFILVGGNPFTQKTLFFFSRVLFRFFVMAMKLFNFQTLYDWAVSRPSFFIWLKAKNYKADLYIAHYVGALPGAAKAAHKNNGLLMFDAEDYHRGESNYYPEQNKHIARIEDRYLKEAAYITAASPLIAEAYQRLFPQKKVVAINNVFSKKFLQQLGSANSEGSFKLFWFSQNIGPNRGLEVIVDALNLVRKDVSLYLLGNDKNPGYIDSLKKKVQSPASLNVVHPVEPDSIFKVAAQYDVGLASEVPHCENRNICLTNKIFTYLLAGNCILASDTDAQKKLLDTYKGVGLVYKHNDATDLAKQIGLLITEKDLLTSCRHQAVSLAANELNWEKEREKLYAILAELLSQQKNKRLL